ncbi:MAG: hypothetical protein JOZ42_16965 [Acetobacteraceae bacterium]|nr:hypothetical protein [Acetobacteraceae bacterium]
MRLSTSSSDWRRFFVLASGTAAGAAALLYAFVVIIDPFGTLPLSPPLPRAPVSTNARFAFPALARSASFDSAVAGTSTSRLLRPAALDPAFGGARFVNLSMNAATAYEQARILGVFLRAHPAPRAVVLGLDIAWCSTGPLQHYTERPFPEWMYGRDRWRGYREMFNLYALTEAWAQFLHVTRLKRSRYGLDGYTSFVPDDSLYDPARVATHLAEDEAQFSRADVAGDPASWHFAALNLLEQILADVPATTPVMLYFVPYNHVLQQPGTDMSAVWAACKAQTVAAAQNRPNVAIADFMIPSPITADDNNYWDALHYRVAIADRMAGDLAAASRKQASAAGDYRLLTAP